MSDYSHEKNILAMLAIPVLLSLVMGLSGDAYARTAQIEREGGEVQQEDTDTEDLMTDRTVFGESGRGMRRMMPSPKALRTQHSVETGNYNDFIDAVRGTPFEDIMTEDAFHTLVREYHTRRGYRQSLYYYPE